MIGVVAVRRVLLRLQYTANTMFTYEATCYDDGTEALLIVLFQKLDAHPLKKT